MIQREGYWWPDHEDICWQQILEDFPDVDKAVSYVGKRSVCVQAGGNCGVWAIHLAKTFDVVITVEPDRENYDCLLRNVAEKTDGRKGVIYSFFGALGEMRGWCGLNRQAGNCGAHAVSGKGDIPVYVIDELVPCIDCDLIVLDMEGMEPRALMGAKETIRRFRPVIMVEDKGDSPQYGFSHRWSETFPGYRVVERVGRHNDPILVPQ